MFQKISEILKDIESNRESLEFLPTGFKILDDSLDGGFLRKELIVIGGSTGIGKSYMSGQILYNIARSGFKTAYFSLEISNQMVVARLLGQTANIKSTHVLTGKTDFIDLEVKEKSKGMLITYEDFMSFYDSVYEYIEIEQEIRRNKYEFIVIDFIQNIMVKGMEEYPKLTFVALSLQKLAKELNCCILLLSQLSNFNSRLKDEMTLEYKGSGSIATVCDLGFFIQRGDPQLNPEDLTLLLKKNRRGPGGLSFAYKFMIPGGYINEVAQDQSI